MPPLTKEECETLLTQASIATLSSHNGDGSIHSTPIWFKYDGKQILFGTQQDTRRIKNIKQNPDVTVVVDDRQTPYKGIVVYGRAELDYDDVIAKRAAIFEKYMPRENALGLAQALAKMRKPVVIRVTPGKMVSYDFAKDPTGTFK
jgi:PPOX class probable F420-dependent enzyme